MTFPRTIHEPVAPGKDPNNPNGVYEGLYTNRFASKILKKFKQAVQHYGVKSPFTLEIVQGLAEVPI